MLPHWLALAPLLGVVCGQAASSWPHDYSGKPSGDFSPEWQGYFEVKNPLPNATFPFPRSFAGNIPVNRAGHENDTLFFWAFENHNGSLAAENSTEPWGIWLNGGPGSSSLVGLLFENGPLHIAEDYSLYPNNYSWSKLADYIWVDQPVGVGFSTADATGYVADEDQMGHDFMNFLANLVKVFPGLKTRPLYLTGESYAGTYIPYITKTYFGMENPPVNLTKIAIGDGSIGEETEFVILPTLNVLETYPQIIGYDTEVYEYFKEQNHLCGYDLNLTYPQNGTFPTLNLPFASTTGANAYTSRAKKAAFEQALLDNISGRRSGVSKRELQPSKAQIRAREQWKRDLSDRANGTIDPWYECDLYDEMVDYALNFTFPWKGHVTPNHSSMGFDVYNVPDALWPEAPMDASVFLNDDRTRAAIHAPTSKNWTESIRYPFGSTSPIDPSVKPMAFLTDLATNATEHGVHVVIYSGNDDSLVPHRGSEVVIQNTTFGGIQGFSERPSTPWFADGRDFAGIVHQERNWTYVLFQGAGHLVPQQQPAHAYIFLREFVLGSNQTGLVTVVNGTIVVIGGENATLAAPALPGQLGIYVGTGTTQSTYTFPSATIAAWNSFLATATESVSTATVTKSEVVEPSAGAAAQGDGAGRMVVSWPGLLVAVAIAVGMCV